MYFKTENHRADCRHWQKVDRMKLDTFAACVFVYVVTLTLSEKLPLTQPKLSPRCAREAGAPFRLHRISARPFLCDSFYSTLHESISSATDTQNKPH